MKRINEIFYSVQGEGLHAGSPAVFIRFSGCNIRCPFCDTVHHDGAFMADEEIINEVEKYPTDLVVVTGGEPTMQLTEEFVEKLHELGKKVCIETNGTREVSRNIDFITLSPKFEFVKKAECILTYCDELKVVYNGRNDMSLYDDIVANHYFLQPCDMGNEEENKRIMEATVAYCLEHPKWRISLQTQKILQVR